MADQVLDERDKRLFAALQCDGRLPAERAAAVLGLGIRTVRRRWAALLGDGVVRVVAVPEPPAGSRVMLLRIKVLRGRIDAVTAGLAARDDIPFIDISAGGDEISAIALSGGPGTRNRLVFDRLPASTAIASVSAQTVLHVFQDAYGWHCGALTARERAELTPRRQAAVRRADETDRLLLAAVADEPRAAAAALAARTGLPDSTVRRRLAALTARGELRTTAVADARRLGLAVDAGLWMRVPPDRLDAAGRRLAGHPAVHGALATTGRANLHAAVWLPDLDALYRFITEDLAGLGIRSVDTVLVGTAVKRPGAALRIR